MSTNRVCARVAVLGGALALLASACGSDSTSAQSTTSVAGSQSSSTVAPISTALSGPTSSVPAPTKSILQLAAEEGSLATMLKLLDTAGLTTTLQGAGPFTLIAPTDAAFAKMDATTLDKISKSPDVLKALLNYHLINGRVSQQDLSAGFVTTAEGSTITLQATNNFPTVNGQTVTKGARATNGTVLVIESVLLPVDLKLP